MRAGQPFATARPRVRLLAATAALVAGLALLVGAPKAGAELFFCPPGSGPGECDQAYGTATDFESGRLYVADRGNDRIQAFTANGAFEFAIEGISGPQWVAVDNVEGSPFKGHLYVGTPGFEVRRYDAEGNFDQAFGEQGEGECQFERQDDPVGVGPGGVIHVGDHTGVFSEGFTNYVHKIDPETGECVGKFFLFEEGTARIRQMAVDSEGNIYVTVEGAGGQLRKYSPAGELLEVRDPGYVTQGIGFDAADNLYAAQREPWVDGFDVHSVITKYNPAGVRLSRFGYNQLVGNVRGTAPFESALGDVFASDNSDEAAELKYLEVPEGGPIVPAVSPEALEVSNVRALLEAEVNPEGKEAEFVFEYVTQQAYEEQGESFEGPATESTAPAPVETPEDPDEFQVHAVKALVGCEEATIEKIEEGECLSPETKYRFRVIATNEDNPEGEGEARAEGPVFETKRAIEVESLFASEVGTDSARLSGVVDPLGIPATGFFEYVSDAQFKASEWEEAERAPAEGELDFGGGEGPSMRSVALSPLVPGTTYHYRFKATNALLGEGAYFESEEGAKALTTLLPAERQTGCANEAERIGAAGFLPDCRAYELVSPPDKEGGDIKVLGGILTGLPAVLNRASTAGGRLAYGSYRAFGDAESAPWTSQYVAQRSAAEWESHGISPPREQLSVPAGAAFDTELKLFSEDLCTAWLQSFGEPILAAGAVEGFPNLYTRRLPGCAEEGYRAVTHEEAGTPRVEVQGASADGETTIYSANAALVTPAPELGGTSPQLYAERGGQTEFLCVLPGGAASGEACSAGGPVDLAFSAAGRRIQVDNALSADGERVFWSTEAGRVYARSNPFGAGAECSGEDSPCTVAVSTTPGSQYWGAAADGSRAVFTTGAFASGDATLHSFELDEEAAAPIATGVYGVAGMSDDARRIYFVSKEEIEGTEGASEGQPNLYLYEAPAGGGEGSYRFIATLTSIDVLQLPGKGESSAASAEPWQRATRVSPDGAHLAFTSTAPLTGYDNTDAQSGEADAEVFLYDAAGGGRLRCASCNPSGGRPAGANVSTEGTFWVAARIPVWQNSLQAARALADDGNRLYFESYDSLVARDTNGMRDVYQWEREGEGSCSEADPGFSAKSGGCVELISSGQSKKDATFIEATPSGSDVFFATLSSLLPHDDDLIDIYDARVRGGQPIPPEPVEECEGESCQSPAPAPEPIDPASLAFRGPGNLASSVGVNRCARRAGRAKRLSNRAKRLRRAAKKSKAPAAKRKRRRSARRSAKKARRLSRNAKRCRARERVAARRSQR